MTDERKLLALIEHYANGNKGTFAEMLSLPRSTITTWLFRGAMTAKGRECILSTFPEVNREWLLHDDPHMIQPEPDTIQLPRENAIPYYEDLPGTCGVVEQFDSPEYSTDSIYIPGINALAALPAQGDSMEPTIHDRDTVIVGHKIDINNVSSSNIYLICTREGQRMVKRLEQDRSVSPRHLMAVSDNPDYSPRAILLDKKSILAIYPVLCVMHRF